MGVELVILWKNSKEIKLTGGLVPRCPVSNSDQGHGSWTGRCSTGRSMH